MYFEKKISVVMPVFNTQIDFLKEAVESILNQSFREFEFIIIDDGTTDGSSQYLGSLSDPRIRIIRNERNLGITQSLNIGFSIAKGKYIARMDSDDISLPCRLQEQYNLMERHPEVIVCGSKTGKIGSDHYNLSGKIKMEDMEEYRIRMLFVNPGPFHPTSFFRHEKLLKHHIQYDENLYYAQDYGMWETISHYGRVCILEDVLLLRREHGGQITKAHRGHQIQCDKMTQRKLLTDLLGHVTDEEMNLHYIHSTGSYPDATITPEVAEWYKRIIKANEQRHIYNSRKLKKYIEIIIKRLIIHSFRNDMSKLDKTCLIFRYLPFLTIVEATSKIIIEKVQSVGRAILNK